MEVKLIAWLFYGLGIPTYLFTMYINITSWKSDVLFVLACVLVGIETYWKIRRNRRADRKAEQEWRSKELEIRERELLLKYDNEQKWFGRDKRR